MDPKKEGVVSVPAVVLKQPCQGDAVCFQVKAKAQYRVTRCVCVCERERGRERQGHITVESTVLITSCVHIHTSFITWLCSPFRLELMIKLRTLLTVFIFTLKAEALDYGKGRYISYAGLWYSAIVSWAIRADCACWKEGLCRKWRVWERWTYNNVKYLKNNVVLFDIKACQHILLHQTHTVMIF